VSSLVDTVEVGSFTAELYNFEEVEEGFAILFSEMLGITNE